ncbi:MAG: flagellar basal body rod protein FlgB [Deltaproteobacteria bacterium]|nr:flagellar basal body rod protein FlgB [Deltaproteobacteria bacterium]
MSNVTGQLFDRTLSVMGKTLGLRLARHSMSTGNLANMDTPGYRVKDLRFEETLQRALGPMEGQLEMRQTNERHVPVRDVEKAYQIAQRDVKVSPYGRDEKGLDVMDIDKEMTKLSKNHLVYNATVQMLAKEFENLKYAISEGGK